MKRHTPLALILLAVSLVACQAVAIPTPVALRQPTPDAPEPADTPSTDEPGATPMPREPRAPRLIAIEPAVGQELPVDAPIILSFDQAMDSESVAGAWSLEPETDGAWEWLDEATALFAPPASGWDRDARYTLHLGTTAVSREGLALQEAVRREFRTVGFLEVTEAFPLPESEDVACDSALRIAFNRPVVPLVGIAEAEDLPQPLVIVPETAGHGEWINTSIYRFVPDEPLAPGTRYVVTVAQGLGDQTGGLLDETYTWSFDTEAPRVLAVSPEPNDPFADPDGGVRITFAQPVDQASASMRFKLRDLDLGACARGDIAWEDDTLVFTPAPPLLPGGVYRATLEAGTEARSGDQTIAEETSWEFTVAGPPSVLSTSIAEGQRNVDRGMGLQISFTQPISRASFAEHLVISPTTKAYSYWNPSSTEVQLSTYLQPSTRYTLSIGANLVGAYGQPIVEPFELHFSTEAMEPMAVLDCPARVSTLSSYGQPVVRARHRNVSNVDLTLYRLPLEDLLALHGNEGWRLWSSYDPGQSDLLLESSLPTIAPLNQTRTISQALELGGEPLASGFYWLSLDARGLRQPDQKALIVSPWNILLKTAQQDLLVWVTDLATGQPVADVSLEVYDAVGMLQCTIQSDSDGLAQGTFDPLDPWESLIVVAQKGDDIGLALRSWNQGISPWEFGMPMLYQQSNYRAHIYTEREIYRPEQTVRFKGILRDDDDGAYSLPSGDTIQVAAIDGEGQQFWRDELPLSEMGTFWGEIELPEDASLGHYTLEATYRAGRSDEYPVATAFQVAEYRKPEFEVAVQVARDDYAPGETIQVSAEASYYFGGPVAKAAVQWQVMRRPYRFDRWDGDYYSFADHAYRLEQPYISEYGALVSEGSGVTDAEGRFTFDLPADLQDQTDSQVYTIEVSVTDLNNQSTSARATTIVHQGAFYIGLRTLNYIGRAGQDMEVEALTVDTQGVPLPDQDVTLVAYRQEWYSVQQFADDGNTYWENEVRLTAVATETIRTDAGALATWSFVPPEGGSYKVVANGGDADGNPVRSGLYLWASGSRYINWGQRNNDRLDLVADAQSYHPGDTARILVPSPYQGAVQALLTIERAGLIEHRLLTLEGNSEQIEVPILPTYAPNVFLSLTLVQGSDEGDVASFKMGYLNLPVSTEESELNIAISSDQDTPYQPRDEVTYDLLVTDSQGQPAQTELALQLVDLAIEALTGATGSNALETFYRERGLGVLTSASLAASLDRHNLEYPDEGKGGGGGGDSPMVREDLPDTAYWAPAVLTDEQGQAQVTVTLPDSLTTWRLRALGVTADTQVGQAQHDVVSTLDLLVRPVAPRFLVVGDQPLLGAVVHNNTDAPQETTVSLSANGLEIAASTQQVLIPAHSRSKVHWPAEVLPTSSVILQYRVSSGSLQDGIDIELPIYRASTPEVVGTAGQVDNAVTERIRLPQGVDPTQGELVVNLEPSLAASLQESLEYLRSYPYDCVEQTVSRFLPSVALYRTLLTLDHVDPQTSGSLSMVVAISLQRLYAQQNLDGGWGWWRGHSSSPELTAYVLQGLVEARDADLAVDASVIARAAGWLRRHLEKTPATQREWDQRATALYALALAGKGDLGRTVNLFKERDQLSLYAQGYLALTLQMLEPEEPDRLSVLANAFAASAIESASGVHWEEAGDTRWAMNTDLRTSAILLRAMVAMQPESDLNARATRWLVSARSAGRWGTTQENAWAVLALCDQMRATGELAGEYSYSLDVNDHTVRSGSVDATTIDEAIHYELPVAEMSSDKDNMVRISRDDPNGKLYYSAFLRTFVAAEDIAPLNRGIIVQRAYYADDDESIPIEGANVNDTVRVKLTLIAPHDLHYVVLENPLPAGCEVIDSSLDTSQSGEDDSFERTDLEGIPEPYQWYWRFAWASHVEMRDEKVALFAQQLPRGTYEYSYAIRCSLPGQFSALPATAYEMYTPDVFGRSAGALFDIAAIE